MKLLKNIIIVTHKKVVLENNATSLTYINGYTGFSRALIQNQYERRKSTDQIKNNLFSL